MTEALIFDVFGTCVDWRSSVARQVAGALPGLDPWAFADAWRAEYQPAMERVRSGARGYIALDDLHRETLALVAERSGVAVADPATLARAWERLDPWPDVVPGLLALRPLYILAPCSNGSIALMTRLARHAGLPWDCILGAEIARDYKPRAAVYETAYTALRLAPSEVMMVAAHNSDLAAARTCGLGTAFVARPAEYGPDQTTDLTAEEDWDVTANNFTELAEKLA